MKMPLQYVCDVVTKWSLHAALFLTPVFFLPVTLYPADLNKQFVFMTLTLVAALAWLVKSLHKGKLEYAKSYAGIPLAALIVFVTISTFFSGARTLSFMGASGGEADTAIAVIGFALLYFLISVSFRERADFRNAGIALLASGTFAVLHFAWQSAGLPIFPWDFAGTVNAFGLYAGFIAVLAFTCAEYVPVSRRMRLWTGILAGASFVLALLIGYWAIFVPLIAALVLLVFFARRNGDKKASRRNYAAFAGIALSAVMLVLATGVVSLPVPRIATPPEVSPSIGASFKIAGLTARSGLKNFLLGSGPATYQYEYALRHDAGLNATPFWNVRFAQGFNAVLTHLVSWGIIGTILFLLFVAGTVHAMARVAAGRRIDPFAAATVALGAYSAIALFLYPQNFVLYFLFFACAGALAALAAEGRGGYASVPLNVPVAPMLGIAAVLALLFVNGRRYVAGVQFARGIAIAAETRDTLQALPLLVSGASLDPRNDAYLTALASAYIAHANALAAGGANGASADLEKAVGEAVASAVAAAEAATQANPRAAGNWVALAQVYETVAPFNAQAASSVLPVYGKAASLDPVNPVIPVYVGNARRAAGEYAAALAAYEAAIALKADYAPAHFAIIRMFDAQGKTADALVRAERLRSMAPDDAAVLLELGALHYQAGRTAKAQEALEQAVRIAPDYANALYFLGLVHDRQGNRAEAIRLFERVLALNPGSAEIKTVLANVRAGRPAIGAGEAPALGTESEAEKDR